VVPENVATPELVLWVLPELIVPVAAVVHPLFVYAAKVTVVLAKVVTTLPLASSALTVGAVASATPEFSADEGSPVNTSCVAAPDPNTTFVDELVVLPLVAVSVYVPAVPVSLQLENVAVPELVVDTGLLEQDSVGPVTDSVTAVPAPKRFEFES
jgi:hypothetical protein